MSTFNFFVFFFCFIRIFLCAVRFWNWWQSRDAPATTAAKALVSTRETERDGESVGKKNDLFHFISDIM